MRSSRSNSPIIQKLREKTALLGYTEKQIDTLFKLADTRKVRLFDKVVDLLSSQADKLFNQLKFTHEQLSFIIQKNSHQHLKNLCDHGGELLFLSYQHEQVVKVCKDKSIAEFILSHHSTLINHYSKEEIVRQAEIGSLLNFKKLLEKISSNDENKENICLTNQKNSRFIKEDQFFSFDLTNQQNKRKRINEPSNTQEVIDLDDIGETKINMSLPANANQCPPHQSEQPLPLNIYHFNYYNTNIFFYKSRGLNPENIHHMSLENISEIFSAQDNQGGFVNSDYAIELMFNKSMDEIISLLNHVIDGIDVNFLREERLLAVLHESSLPLTIAEYLEKKQRMPFLRK